MRTELAAARHTHKHTHTHTRTHKKSNLRADVGKSAFNLALKF